MSNITQQTIGKILIFILILSFYGSFLVYKINLPAAHDLARHVTNGQQIMQGNFDVLSKNVYSYTMPEHSFVNHHWLSGVIFYLFYQAVGWGGLVVLKTIILLAMFSILFLTALKKSNFWLVSIFSIPTILILSERTGLRPEIFSYLFIAIFLYLLIGLEENLKSKKVYWLIPIQILWVNMHIFSIIGPLILAGFLFERIILNIKNLKNDLLIKKLSIILLILLVVSFANPNGLNGVLYPLQIFNDYGMDVTENSSLLAHQRIGVPWADASMVTFVLAVFILALSSVFNLRKRPVFYLLAGASTAVGGFAIIRFLPLFGIVFLLVASINCNGLSAKIERLVNKSGPHRQKIKIILTTVFVLLICYFVSLSFTKSTDAKHGLGLEAHTVDAAEFFKNNNLRGPIFNDYDISSYLIHNLYPEHRVFIDNRPEAYSGAFFRGTYLPMISSEDAWNKALEVYDFNSIFFYRYDGGPDVLNFLYKRINDSEWTLVYADRYAVIFLRNNALNQEIINKFRITRDNVSSRMDYLRKSDVFQDQVAAADNFNLVGRVDLGRETFLQVVSRWPNKGKIWMVLAETELVLNHSSRASLQLAKEYLLKAIDSGYTTAEAYSFLGSVYSRMGDYAKARDVLNKALRINPDHRDAINLLEKIKNEN